MNTDYKNNSSNNLWGLKYIEKQNIQQQHSEREIKKMKVVYNPYTVWKVVKLLIYVGVEWIYHASYNL